MTTIFLKPAAARRHAKAWPSRYVDSTQWAMDGVAREFCHLSNMKCEDLGGDCETMIFHPDRNDLPEGKTGTVYLRALAPMQDADLLPGDCYATSGHIAYAMLHGGLAERVTEEVAQEWSDRDEERKERVREGARTRRRLIRHLNQIRRLHRRAHGPSPAPERLPARIEGASPPAPQQDSRPVDPGWLGPTPQLQGFFDPQDHILTHKEHCGQIITAAWTRFVSVLPLGVDAPRFVPWRMMADGLEFTVHFGLACLDRSRCPTNRTVRIESIPFHRNWFVGVIPVAEGTLYMLQRWGTSWPINFPRQHAHKCPGQQPDGKPVEPWYPPHMEQAA